MSSNRRKQLKPRPRHLDVNGIKEPSPDTSRDSNNNNNNNSNKSPSATSCSSCTTLLTSSSTTTAFSFDKDKDRTATSGNNMMMAENNDDEQPNNLFNVINHAINNSNDETAMNSFGQVDLGLLQSTLLSMQQQLLAQFRLVQNIYQKLCQVPGLQQHFDPGTAISMKINNNNNGAKEQSSSSQSRLTARLLQDCLALQQTLANANSVQNLSGDHLGAMISDDDGDEDGDDDDDTPSTIDVVTADSNSPPLLPLLKIETGSEQTAEQQQEQQEKQQPDDQYWRHRCRICHKVFGSTSALQIHMRSHTGERPFQCNICTSRFSTKGNLKVHILRHRIRDTLLPMQGGFSNNSDLLRAGDDELMDVDVMMDDAAGENNDSKGDDDSSALAQAAPSRQPTECKICRRVLSCRSALLMHQRVHSGDRPFRCHQCHRAFTTKGNLRSHMFIHGQPLLQESSSRDHFSTLFGGGSNKRCEICRRTFANIFVWQQHMRQHKLDGQRTANEHPASSSAASSARSSTNNLPEDPSSTSPRPICLTATEATSGSSLVAQSLPPPPPRDFASPSSSASRKQTVCPFCSKLLSCRSALEIHVRSHTKERPFECNICARHFSTKGNLKQHLLTHADVVAVDAATNIALARRRCRSVRGSLILARAGSDPFGVENLTTQHLLQSSPSIATLKTGKPSISILTSGTNSQMTAKTTTNTAHNNIADLSVSPQLSTSSSTRHSNQNTTCNVCGKTFSCASALEIHSRTHTGDRPFACHLCSRAFTTKGNLKVHINTHLVNAADSLSQRHYDQRRPSSILSLPHGGGDDESSHHTNESGVSSSLPVFASATSHHSSSALLSNNNNNLLPIAVSSLQSILTPVCCFLCQATLSSLAELEDHFKTKHANAASSLTSDAKTRQTQNSQPILF